MTHNPHSYGPAYERCERCGTLRPLSALDDDHDFGSSVYVCIDTRWCRARLLELRNAVERQWGNGVRP